MILAPEIRDGWRAYNAPWEGDKNFLYADDLKLVTTGAGNLVDPVRLTLELTWHHPDGSLATQDEIRREFNRVKSIAETGGPRGYVAEHYLTPNALRLADADITALVLRRYDGNASVLLGRRPSAVSWPTSAIKAVMSMGWACGIQAVLDPARWPHLSAALDAERWDLAAASCMISELNNPGVHPRNLANRVLFLAAVDESTRT